MANPSFDEMRSRTTFDEHGCWNWDRYVQSNGYGKLTVNRKTHFAHRLMYAIAIGCIPKDMDVCHKCDNRRCINPDHLFLGTRKENMQDAVRKGRQAKGFMLPQTKITELVAAHIVEMAKAGRPYEAIAQQFGICRQHAGFIALQHGVRRNGIS